MPPFDWVAFLDRNNVPWVGPGTNVSQGHVGICCFLCSDDPSYHLGIDLATGRWSCWRDPTHRGGPVYLIQRLAKITKKAAQVIWEGAASATKADLLELEQELLFRGKSEAVIRPIQWGVDEFELDDSYSSKRFLAYLKTRGFHNPEWVAKEYGIRGALSGAYAHRVLFPLTIEGTLYGWSGRAIAPSRIRYKTHPPGPQVRSLVYNYDQVVAGGDILVICEGPVDALTVDVLGRIQYCRAVALLGVHMTPGKRDLITRLADGFGNVCVLLDSDALGVALRLKAELGFLRQPVYLATLPEGCKDPGELSSLEDLKLSLTGT